MIKFISEISSNHNNSLDRSLKMIKISSELGFDIVKFQLFKIDKLFSKDILNKSKEHRDRKKWELNENFIPILSKYCKKKKIKFCVTPFYLEAVDIIEPFVDIIKISSYEILWEDLLIKCARTKKPIIISTGMANMKEVKNSIKILKKNGAEKIIVLHCVSCYPTSLNSLNLSAIKTLKKETKLEVGWSDHSANKLVVYRAIEKWGASYVEMHLDLDGKGYEYKKDGHCWLPKDVKDLINFINLNKLIDGQGVKRPDPKEFNERNFRADPSDGLRPLKKYRFLN
jgi:sialic acid synthase SpsE